MLSKVLIFTVLLMLVFGLLAALPAIEIDKDAVTSSAAWSWIIAGMYFFPVGTVLAILTVIVGLGVFRIILAAIKMVWDILPVV